MSHLPPTWQAVPLDSLTQKDRAICYGVVQPGPEDPQGVLFIRGGDIQGGEVSKSLRTITHKVAEQYRRTNLIGGEIVISLVGYPGQTAIVPKHLAGANVARQVGVIAIRPQVDNEYVQHFLESPMGQDALLHPTIGSAQQVINIAELKRVNIVLPPFDEQRAISRIINIWDRGIRRLTDLIAAKVRFKQGQMQQLLSGQRRFKEFETRDLRACELQDFLTVTSRPIDRPAKAYKALGLRSHGKGTFVRFVEDPEQVQMDTLYQVKKDDLIVNITFAWEGAIAIVSEQDEEAFVSHRFPTFVFDQSKALPEYIRQVVITPWFIFKMGLVSPGGAGRNRVLNKKDFLKIEIPLPKIDEQSRIASFLGEADREITLLRKQLDALKLQKKGLMQKLMTGEVRVKL